MDAPDAPSLQDSPVDACRLVGAQSDYLGMDSLC